MQRVLAVLQQHAIPLEVHGAAVEARDGIVIVIRLSHLQDLALLLAIQAREPERRAALELFPGELRHAVGIASTRVLLARLVDGAAVGDGVDVPLYDFRPGIQRAERDHPARQHLLVPEEHELIPAVFARVAVVVLHLGGAVHIPTLGGHVGVPQERGADDELAVPRRIPGRGTRVRRDVDPSAVVSRVVSMANVPARHH
mmetsp:Transcript_24968/g.78184  ORF Transcript_24968/g.78184 Transcript_24968/m.78184 type:complete len:200 (-) Transcript_24968:1188-1787(-)